MTREERAYNYASKKHPSKFTVGEISKHYDDGYTDGYKDTVVKAYDWLIDRYENQGVILLEDINELKRVLEKRE